MSWPGTFITPSSAYEGIDQGIDFSAPTGAIAKALAPGHVTHISPPGSWAGGTGQAVYEQLDTPIVQGGRTYTGIYYAEEGPAPGVAVNTPLKVGDPVLRFTAGQSEIGFASGNEPAAPRPAPRPAPQWTQGGQDFHDWFYGGATPGSVAGGGAGGGVGAGPGSGSDSGGTGGGSSAAAGGAAGTLAGAPTSAAGIGGDITGLVGGAATDVSGVSIGGSLKEAGLRIVMFLGGLILLFMALKQIGRGMGVGVPPITINQLTGAVA